MADMSPFNPEFLQSTPQPGAMPEATQGQDPGLADRWRSFLGDPASRAALISFGLQLAQPVALGQNTLGHIGQAFGAAGESATKSHKLAEGDVERESKQIQREAQANAATSRAETARANSETAATRAAAYESGIASQNALREERAKLLQQQRDFWQKRVEDYPDDVDAKRRLAESQILFNNARTDFVTERAGVVRQDADTRGRSADARARDAETRAAAQRDRTTLETQRIEQGDRRIRQQGDIAAAKGSREEQALYQKFINDPFTSAADKKLTIDQWREKIGSRGAPSQPGGSPAPSAPAPSPSITQPAGGQTPPVEGARFNERDGQWYKEINGQWFRVRM